MPLTLALNILIKKKPGTNPSSTRKHRFMTPSLKVDKAETSPKVDNEALLRRVMEENQVLLLPGGDGFNVDENIKKERVLTLCDRLFDSDTALAKLKLPIHKPPDCYLLIYSGPAMDGNWMFQDEKVFLNEVLEKWHKAEHYKRGAVLYILSDCDKSGLWLRLADDMVKESEGVFLQVSCGPTELRGNGKGGHEENFMKHWCNIHLGTTVEEAARAHLAQIGQSGVSAFAPFGLNFPVVSWAKPLEIIGERIHKSGTEAELVPHIEFLDEAMRKAEQLQPLTNMPVQPEQPRLLSTNEVERPSKRAEQAFRMARTSPMLAEQSLPVWGRMEPQTVLLGNIDLEQIVTTLRRYVLHEELAVLAVQLLWRLSWHEEYRLPVVEAGALETVLKALELHIHNPALVCAGCGLVCRLRVTAGFRHKVLAVRGIETLVQAMRHQADKPDVQRFGCVALNVIAAPPDPATGHNGDVLGGPPELANAVEAIDVCVAALDGPVGTVADVVIAAMGAANGVLQLDEIARQTLASERKGSSAEEIARHEKKGQIVDLVPLVKAVAKVLSVHVEDPAVIRQGCQLLDALAAGRYKTALAKSDPTGHDVVKALLAGLHTHRDLDDVVWQLMATMTAIAQLPALKSRLISAGARTALMGYPKTRSNEMPRWLEGALNPLLVRLGMAGRK